MIQIKGLDHVVIRARALDKMIVFYRDVLGCPVERALEPEIGLVQLRAGNALIDLVSVDSELGRLGGMAPGSEGHNMDHFCIRLETFDEAVIRTYLLKHGIEASELATRYGAEGFGPSIYIKDPEGNTVELKGPPEQSVT